MRSSSLFGGDHSRPVPTWLTDWSYLGTTLVILSLCLVLVAGCESAAADDDTQGAGSDGDSLPEVPEEDVLEAILFVYHAFNYYAVRTPEVEGASSFFAGNTVTVTKQDSTDDLMNAYYEDTVGVDFDGYTENGHAIIGSGVVVAFIDSYNGAEGATYSGSFTGSYDGSSFTMTMDYGVQKSAGVGITSAGTFTFNGGRYEVQADSQMWYEFSGP